ERGDVVGQEGEGDVGDREDAVGPAGRLLRVDEPGRGLAGLQDEVTPAHRVAEEVGDEPLVGLGGHRAAVGHAHRTSPWPRATSPISTARWPAVRSVSIVRCASSGGTATPMPSPMLNVRSISASATFPPRWISPKIGGTSQLDRSTTASWWAPRARGRLPTMPPPVMWAMPCTSTTRSSSLMAGA